MREEINEVIKMFAFFDGGKITPIAFSWHGRRYEKLKLISHWGIRNGAYLNHHFSLSYGSDIYEVVFDTRLIQWRLVSIS